MNHALRGRQSIVSPLYPEKEREKVTPWPPTPSGDLAEFCDIALIFPLFA